MCCLLLVAVTVSLSQTVLSLDDFVLLFDMFCYSLEYLRTVGNPPGIRTVPHALTLITVLLLGREILCEQLCSFQEGTC